MASPHVVSVIGKKAKEHYDCAVLAEGERMLNSAVSRYYYACLLYAKKYVFANTTLSDQDFEGKQSHIKLNDEFGKLVIKDTNYSQNALALGGLFSMKLARNNADYSGSYCYNRIDHKQDYIDFKDKVDDFIHAINQLK